jgi:hypothetical protein
MDSPSFGSLGTNNVLVGTRIHAMSDASIQTAETAALAEAGEIHEQRRHPARPLERESLALWAFISPIGIWAPGYGWSAQERRE